VVNKNGTCHFHAFHAVVYFARRKIMQHTRHNAYKTNKMFIMTAMYYSDWD